MQPGFYILRQKKSRQKRFMKMRKGLVSVEIITRYETLTKIPAPADINKK